MPSKKELREYSEKYMHIPNTVQERVAYLLETLKITNKQMKNIKKRIISHRLAKWNNINLVFYFVPKATPRARYSGFTKKFYVSDAKNNSDLMEKFVKENLKEFPLITTACRFYCDTYFPIPDSGMTKEEKILAELGYITTQVKPDWDNIGKTYSDMIQKHLILDDCNIIDGRVRKFYSIKPRIEVRIEFMENYDSKYNKRKIEGRKVYKENLDRIIEADTIQFGDIQ